MNNYCWWLHAGISAVCVVWLIFMADCRTERLCILLIVSNSCTVLPVHFLSSFHLCLCPCGQLKIQKALGRMVLLLILENNLATYIYCTLLIRHCDYYFFGVHFCAATIWESYSRIVATQKWAPKKKNIVAITSDQWSTVHICSKIVLWIKRSTILMLSEI